jgi:RimJ/RimL family protein N-acetyltransferase
VNLQPTLRGELVEVRPLRVDDFDDLHALASDPLVWEQHPARDRWREDVFRRYFDEQLASGGGLAVVAAATGVAVGSSRYHDHDAARSEVEIGWTFLGRPYWGGAYNGELKQLMLDHAFAAVERVVFCIAHGNVRSRRSVEKLGARRVGERRGMLLYELVRRG